MQFTDTETEAMTKRHAKTISLPELLAMFSTERKAVAWIERARWQGKPICPHCGTTDGIRKHKPVKFAYWCKSCRSVFTVKTNTAIHASKLPIRKWGMAIYLILTARKGISSLQLSKELGITQKSAWFMLQRIREACKAGDFKLSGVIEVDETYIGGKERNKHESKKLHAGRGAVGKAAVLGMRERQGKVKAMPVTATDKETLHAAINRNVEAGAVVFTDEHRGYFGLKRHYKHSAVKHSAKEFVNGMAHTNGIESVWAVLKRGHDGTFHHISTKHLERYVNEFTFRLNEGNVSKDTIDRMSSLCGNISGKRITYKDLTR